MRAITTFNWHSAPLKKQQLGMAYLAVLILIFVAALSLTLTSVKEETRQRRQKELDWWFIGKQYQRAITSYYQLSPQGLQAFPKDISDLLKDQRAPAMQRHLRKAFLDPMTEAPWALVTNADGAIVGVRSRSTQAIFRSQVLAELGLDASQAQVYADVVFEFKPMGNEGLPTNPDGLQGGVGDMPS